MNASVARVMRRFGVQIVLIVAIWIGFAATTPALRGESGLYSVLVGFPLLGLIALGAATVMLAGELDVSLAGLVAVSGAIAVRASSLGLVPAVLIVVAAATLIGIVQGLVIATLRINSLIVTIGSLIILEGAAFVICGGKPLNVSDISIIAPLFDRKGVLSWAIVVALAVFLLVALFLGYFKLGREIYAIGGGRKEALAAGVPLWRPIVTAFAISAACCGLAGALAALGTASAQPTAAPELLLQAVTAALVGGISLYGGRGSVGNVVLGTALLTLLAAGLVNQGAQNYVVLLSTGALLFAVVVLEYVFSRLRITSGRPKFVGSPA